MTIGEFQRHIDAIYYDRDRARGVAGTFQWFTEEVGELAQALRKGNRAALEGEFADVLAWLSTLASLTGVDLERAIGKYARGCPRCAAAPCNCP